MTRIKEVRALGQQIWLDSLSRQLIQSGALQALISDGVAGVTSNPAIFQSAIAKDASYQAALKNLPASLTDAELRFEALALPDIQAACDLFRPIHESTEGEAGYVSFEVAPELSHDAEGTIAAAKRLWAEIARPNVMIKIPATEAGLVAVEEAISEGINVNVTLMFSHDHVSKVFDAYCAGLRKRIAAKKAVRNVRLVASVFVSRWDSKLDPILAERAPHLCGKVAIASAKTAYVYWKQRFAEPFAALEKEGAAKPMLLWASTGTKNSNYSDVLYVESLIGPHTVNTVPDGTLKAFLDHGSAASQLERDVGAAQDVMKEIAKLGIDLTAYGQTLQEEGLALFEKAFDELLALVK